MFTVLIILYKGFSIAKAFCRGKTMRTTEKNHCDQMTKALNASRNDKVVYN